MLRKSRDWFRPYLGGAFLWRGRVPQLYRRPPAPGEILGVDCWGLYQHCAAHDFGKPVDDFGAAYPADGEDGRVQARAKISAELPRWFEVPWEEGAAALFSIEGRPVHIGICLAQHGLVLHADADVGVDTFRISQAQKWKRRFAGCYLPY